MPRTPAPIASPRRQTAEERRDALLDVARALVLEGGPAAVTMGRVADRAEVTRALVYKHFDNRDDVLAALYRHDAAALDRRLRGQVAAADDGFEPKLRSFVHVVLEAVDTHAAFFAPLRPFGHDPTQRRQQRSWDRRTLDYFTTLAAQEFGLEEATARPAVSILLSGMVSLLTQARADRSPGGRAGLEDVFVEVAMGGLRSLAPATRPRPRPELAPPGRFVSGNTLDASSQPPTSAASGSKVDTGSRRSRHGGADPLLVSSHLREGIMNMSENKRTKRAAQAQSLLPDGQPVRGYVEGRAHARLNPTVILVAAAILVAMVVGLLFGRLLIPGVGLVFIVFNQVRPPRALAVTDAGVMLFRRSFWSSKPVELIASDPAPLITSVSATQLKVGIDSEQVTLTRHESEQLRAALAGLGHPMPPGIVGS